MNDYDESSDDGGLIEPLRDPVGILRRRWRSILGVMLLGLTATAAFVLLFVEPRFVGKATILVSSQRIPESFVQATVQEDIFERLNAMVGEIMSRERLSRLIEQHELYTELGAVATRESLVNLMRKSVSIGPDRDARPMPGQQEALVFAIEFRHQDPEVAATIANELASQFIAEHVRLRSQQARLTTEFLRRELERADAALREQNGLITEFKQQHLGELPGELDTNLRKLERLQQQRQALSTELIETETRLMMLSAQPLAPEEDSPEGRLETLRAELAEKVGVLTEEHPNVSSLRRQIAAMEAEIARGGGGRSRSETSRAAMASGARRTLVELRAQKEEVEREIQQLDARVARTPERQEKLSAFEEKASVLRESYTEFLRKVKEAELAETLESAQQGERISVLDRALPPEAPERARLKYLAAGLAGSLLAALGLAVLLEVLDPVLVAADQIEKRFDLPVLGSAPRISRV